MTRRPISDNLRGMALMTLSMAAFAAADGFIKVATGYLSQGQIIWITGVAGAALFALAAQGTGQRPVTVDLGHRVVLLRVLTEALGTVGIVMALALAPLSAVVAIMQSVPLLVTLGAALFLGEAVGARRWAAIAVGLCGVLLIVRPGTGDFSAETLFAVLAATSLAARDLCTRRVPRSASNFQLGCWGFAGLVPTGLFLSTVLATPPGAVSGLPLVLLAGITATTVLAIWAITAAMRSGDVAVVSPFRYTRLVFGLMIAMIFFGERPDTATWVGAAIIVASGLYALYRETRARDVGTALG